MPKTFSGQFGRAATQPFSGRVIVINEFTPTKVGVPKRLSVDLGPIITRIWDRKRVEIEKKKAPKFFNERAIGPDKGKKSFRTSKTHVQLSNVPQLFAGVDGRGFTIRAVISGNTFSTHIRTPGAAPEGLDPGFRARFDGEITLDVDIQDTRLVSRPAAARIPHVERLSGTNLTGKALLVVTALVKELGGPDWVGELLAVLNSGAPIGPAITLELSKLLPILSQAPGAVGINPGFDAGARSITFTVTHAQPFREPH